ncbi:unnamed protein product [Chrysodeixis includens]|uniref:Uncharacterized protein n=1 Tax=Chrysodeixis includens TaxID=689277 RepID=A0A9N8Q079_CHRIL|nr:unnamed protein product [Chrysodeixis includens]
MVTPTPTPAPAPNPNPAQKNLSKKKVDKVISNRIRLAMSAIESVSCIMFKESPMRPPEDAGFTWLYITNPEKARECKHTSFVGSQGHAVKTFWLTSFRGPHFCALGAVAFVEEGRRSMPCIAFSYFH